MPDLKAYPHRAILDANPIIFAKSWDNADLNVCKASLENLRDLVPDKLLDTDRNIDLLAIAFNGSVINIANKNDDIMDTETAISSLPTQKGKFLNMEHKRDRIIGHIVSAGFSSFGESKILTEDDIRGTNDPFNISLGAAVYKMVDRSLASAIEDSADPDSPNYGLYSASWEIAFADYRLALGSKNISRAEIIDDPKHIDELKKNLRAYGGSGKYKDVPIYRLIGKECLALGHGLTKNPASYVKSLITDKTQFTDENKSTAAAFFGSFFSNLEKNKKLSVTSNTTTMENLEQFMEEIKASLLSNKVSAKVVEEAMASMTKDFAEKIKEANTDYLAQINESKAAREKAEKETAEIKASLDAQVKELAETKEKLAKLESDSQAKASAELFSARLAEFDAEFDLDDEDRKVLAADIKLLDNTAESFAAYKGKMGFFMKDKNKKVKEEKSKEAKASLDKLVAERFAEIAKASGGAKLSDKELAEKALEQAKASEKGVIPNNNGSQGEQKSLREKYATAFAKENIVISK